MPTIKDVKRYIAEKFATDIPPENLPDEIDLLATGILTSVTTAQLLGWCGRTYKIPINAIQINPASLKTPAGIAEFIDVNRADTLAS